MSVFFLLCFMCFGFFDFLFFCVFFCLMTVLLLFNYYGGSFMGIFVLDSVSFFLCLLTVFLLVFCCFGSMMDKWSVGVFKWYYFYLFSIFSVSFFCFCWVNYFLFYFSFEFVFVLMFLYLLGWGYSMERLQASFYMVFYTIVVSFPFFVYMVILSLEESSVFFCFLKSSTWWFLVIFVFLVKLPVYGVHLWLPKAHVEAPVAGSMVLAGVLLKLGGYGIYRFSFFFSGFYGGYVFSVGLVGGLISCFLCLRQVDLKSFVAYSSVCHMGFGLSGLYSYGGLGGFGFLLMLISHGFVSSCLFYFLYVVYKRVYTRSLMVAKGFGSLSPLLTGIFFVFSSVNMGVPPSFSFFSEIMIIMSLGVVGNLSLFFCFLVVFFAGVYCVYLFVCFSHGSQVVTSLVEVYVREYLVFYSHFFPLVFFVLCFFLFL